MVVSCVLICAVALPTSLLKMVEQQVPKLFTLSAKTLIGSYLETVVSVAINPKILQEYLGSFVKVINWQGKI